MKFGYINVNLNESNEARQLAKMKKLAIEDKFIFVDKSSGGKFERQQYHAMKKAIIEGDLIYLTSLDMLGKDYSGIIKEWKQITRELKADIVILENETLFDSRRFKSMGDVGKIMEDQFINLLSYVAEQECKKNKNYQPERIALAKAAENMIVIG